MEFRHVAAKPLILLDDENSSPESTNTHFASRIILPIVLAGTWCAPGIREGGGDLPPWKRFHGPEGARQAGMPAGANACDRQTGRPYVPRRKWRCGTWDRSKGRQTPDGRALEAFVLSTNSCALQLPARLPTYQQRPDAKAGVATMKRVQCPLFLSTPFA